MGQVIRFPKTIRFDMMPVIAPPRRTDFITQIAPNKFVVGEPEQALMSFGLDDDSWYDRFLLKYFPNYYAERQAKLMEKSVGKRVVRMEVKS